MGKKKKKSADKAEMGRRPNMPSNKKQKRKHKKFPTSEKMVCFWEEFHEASFSLYPGLSELQHTLLGMESASNKIHPKSCAQFLGFGLILAAVF